MHRRIYSGGKDANPTYSEMKDHTESYLVEFDRKLITYEIILEKWRLISSPYPAGRQYRTAISPANSKQEAAARSVADMENIAIEPMTWFYMAEERHQNFLDRL